MEQKDDILLSVCIPSYNRAELVEYLVKQCLEIFPDEGVEILVSDNASTDDTPDRLRAITDPRFRYVRHEEMVSLENHKHYNNLLVCMELGHGKWCMDLTDKDEFESINWPHMKKLLQEENGVAIYKGEYRSREGDVLSPLPPRTFKGGEADAYRFLIGTSSYATNHIVRRDYLMKALDQIEYDMNSALVLVYPHVMVFACCLQYGTLSPMEGMVIRRQLPAVGERTRNAYAALAATTSEPYWTHIHRVQQQVEWIRFHRSLITDPQEQLKLLNDLFVAALNIIGLYYEQITADEVPSQHLIRPDILARDQARPPEYWHHFYWESYMRLAKEISKNYPKLSAVNEANFMAVYDHYEKFSQLIEERKEKMRLKNNREG